MNECATEVLSSEAEGSTLNTRPCSVVGETASPVCSTAFAEMIVDSIVAVTGEYRGAYMRVTAYSPPATMHPGQGFLEIVLFWKEGTDDGVAFGVYFGDFNRQRKNVFRSDFDRHSWSECKRDPGTSGIVAANWEEAWLIACMLGERHEVDRVQLCHGA